MSQRWLKIALAGAVALAGAMIVQTADADEVLAPDETPVNVRLANLEAEMQQLRASTQAAQQSAASPSDLTMGTTGATVDPTATPATGCGASPPCGPMIGQDFFNSACRVGGFVAGAEVVFFKPFYSGGGAPNVDAAASNPFTGFVNYAPMPYNYQAAPRVWFGYVGANGLGGRVRFFDYHQSAANDVSVVFGAPPNTFTQTGSLALRTYDLELTQQVDFRYWRLQGFAGVRYAQVNQQSIVDFAGFSAFNSVLSYHGVGLTGGLQGERALTANRRWSLFASGRGSLLYGNQHDNTFDAFGLYTNGDRDLQNAFASIWEMSVGPQWKHHLRRGGDLFFRASAEGQYWQGVGNFAPIGTSPVFGLNRNDYAGGFGLLGFAGSCGIMR